MQTTFNPMLPFFGTPMQSSLVEGAPLETSEGRCVDLDGDGDADLFSPSSCYDCSAPFGPFTVWEQTAPMVFEVVASGDEFSEDLYGGDGTLMHLFDPDALDMIHVIRDATLLSDPKTNFAVRRALAPLEWEHGRHMQAFGFEADRNTPLDVDLDGLDELVLTATIGETIERDVYLYRLATE